MLPDRYVSISHLREAAHARADASSQRTVAREVGIGLRSLQLFLAGSRPQQKTLDKLLAWYHEHVERTEGPPISATDALLVLVRALPSDRRRAASGAVITTLREFHASAGVEFPPDLLAVASERGRPGDGSTDAHMAE